MISRLLYFVTDCDFPKFPLSAIARRFQVISIPYSIAEMHWFNWEASGCLVFEFQKPDSAAFMLDRVRSEWISIPTVFFDTHPDSESRSFQAANFSAVIDDRQNVDQIAEHLTKLMDQDQIGDPSPLLIRQRLGRLASQERKVLLLTLDGLTSKEIAGRIGIRSQTVDKYKRNALVRMKARNMMTLLRLLFQSLTLRPGHSELNDSDSQDLSAVDGVDRVGQVIQQPN